MLYILQQEETVPLKPTPCQQEYEAKMLKRVKQMSQVNSTQAASDREEVTKQSSVFKNRTVDCKHQLRQDAIQTLGNDPNYFTESLKTNNQGMVARACSFSTWEVAARESRVPDHPQLHSKFSSRLHETLSQQNKKELKHSSSLPTFQV